MHHIVLASQNPICLTKGPHSATFFCRADQVSRPVAGKENTSNPDQTSLCAARPHAGAGASAHVLNHISNKIHKQATQNSHQHPKTHYTTQSKHHEQHAYPYYKRSSNTLHTQQNHIITIQETKLDHHHIQNTQNNKLHSHTHRQSSKVRRRTTHIH